MLLIYQVLLAAVVYFAWPKDNIRLDLTENFRESSQLVNLFFLGQYILASLMAPSFAAGAVASFVVGGQFLRPSWGWRK